MDPFKVVIKSAWKSVSSECFVISKQSKETIYFFILLLWLFISTWHDLVPRDILRRVQQLVKELLHGTFSNQKGILEEAEMIASTSF